MQLDAFRVQHFRSLYQTDWIRFFDLTLFTGENDGGKSSTLYALELFFDAQKQPSVDDFSYCDPDDAAGERYTDIHMWARLSLNEQDQQLLEQSVGVVTQSIVVHRAFAQTREPAPFLLLAPGHADPRFHKDLSSYTVAELRALADEFAVEVARSAAKPILIKTLRDWLADQPKQDTERVLPAELSNRLPRMEIFSSESAANPSSWRLMNRIHISTTTHNARSSI